MTSEKRMDYVILGLLGHEPMTGYEIKKRMDTTLKFFWGASFGSIYPTLNGLARDGMVTKYETKENGRVKLIYTITETGREQLKEWLYLPVEKDELRYETLLKLFFGSEVGEKGTVQHILNFENKIRNELPFLEDAVNELEKMKDTDEAHLYYMMTAMFGVKVYGAYLEWCDEIKQIIEKRGGIK
ncbi:MAG: PadR family transcriptional regulator [Ruminiclostridium sp.]